MRCKFCCACTHYKVLSPLSRARICTFVEIKNNSKNKKLNFSFASHWPRTGVDQLLRPGVCSITTILSGRHLAAAKQLFSYLEGSNPGLDCKTLFLDSYTLSGVVMRRATWSLAGAPRPVWRWIEQVNTLFSPAKPFPHVQSAAGQLQGGAGLVQVCGCTTVQRCTRCLYKLTW